MLCSNQLSYVATVIRVGARIRGAEIFFVSVVSVNPDCYSPAEAHCAADLLQCFSPLLTIPAPLLLVVILWVTGTIVADRSTTGVGMSGLRMPCFNPAPRLKVPPVASRADC